SGMGALLPELNPLLHLDCMTVTRETLGGRLADAEAYVERSVIAARQATCEPQVGALALFASLASTGAILMRRAADPTPSERAGRLRRRRCGARRRSGRRWCLGGRPGVGQPRSSPAAAEGWSG